MASGMNNLTTLIKRLEAATSRLEDIASSTSTLENPYPNGQSTPTSSLDGETAASEAVSAPVSVPTKRPVPESVEAFDALIDDDLKAFSTISDSLGGVVAEQSSAFATAFKAQRNVISIATRSKEPSQSTPVYMEILKDLVQGIESVNSLRDKNRKSPQENHLSMLSDGVAILSWVTIKPSPDNYVAEVLGGAQFYGNKILTAFKEKGTQDVDWVKSFVKLCGALIQYIKQYHPKGLEWNITGTTPEEALRTAEAGESTSNGASTTTPTALPTGATAAPPPPPPPPPPPLPQLDPSRSVSQSQSQTSTPGDMGAVFAELNKGESVTAGLRKVDTSEMTHKNPSLRSQGAADETSTSSTRGKSPTPPIKKQKPESMRAKKSSLKELDGNKWLVENFENEQSPIELDAERQHSVLVSKCKSVTIKVNGKANAITADSCSRVDLLVDSLVSSVDVINSSNFRMQVIGTLPSIQMDKVDNATVFLSKESLSAEIYTSKCSAINITLPPKGEQDDSVECPIPEQIKSTIVDGKLVSEIVKQEG